MTGKEGMTRLLSAKLRLLLATRFGICLPVSIEVTVLDQSDLDATRRRLRLAQLAGPPLCLACPFNTFTYYGAA